MDLPPYQRRQRAAIMPGPPAPRSCPMLRTLGYLVVLTSLALAVVYGYPQVFQPRRADADERQQTIVPVVVSTLRMEILVDSMEALGTLQANESVVITPNVSDHLIALHFDDGQTVEKGQLLVELTVGEEEALLLEAIALRDDQRMRKEQIDELYKQGMSSEGELSNRKALLSAAQARVIRLEAQIADHKIVAPFAGTLGLRRVSEGAFVDPHTVITTLDDLDVMKLDFTIPETYLSALKVGMDIQAQSDAYPDDLFEGTLKTIDTHVDPRTRAVTMRAMLPNPDRKLRPGMLMKVRVVRSRKLALVLPEEALIPSDRQQRVFYVDADDIARLRAVTIGRRRLGAVEVLKGLEVGDRVVVEGMVRVRPDREVLVVETRSGTERL